MTCLLEKIAYLTLWGVDYSYWFQQYQICKSHLLISTFLWHFLRLVKQFTRNLYYRHLLPKFCFFVIIVFSNGVVRVVQQRLFVYLSAYVFQNKYKVVFALLGWSCRISEPLLKVCTLQMLFGIQCTFSSFSAPGKPRAGSGVVRMDPLRFLAGCRTRRLNQA